MVPSGARTVKFMLIEFKMIFGCRWNEMKRSCLIFEVRGVVNIKVAVRLDGGCGRASSAGMHTQPKPPGYVRAYGGQINAAALSNCDMKQRRA